MSVFDKIRAYVRVPPRDDLAAALAEVRELRLRAEAATEEGDDMDAELDDIRQVATRALGYAAAVQPTTRPTEKSALELVRQLAALTQRLRQEWDAHETYIRRQSQVSAEMILDLTAERDEARARATVR